MECEFLKSPPNVAEWKTGDHDCLWILFHGITRTEPLPTRLLQWVDWKLRGTLSKYLQAKEAAGTTFVPTVNRLPANFVALENGNVDWDAFLRNCEGMKLKRVLMLSTGSDALTAAERELKARKKAGFPEFVYLTQDSNI